MNMLCTILAAVAPLYAPFEHIPGDALIMTNVEAFVAGRVPAPKRYAMFVIPLNATASTDLDAAFGQFELKASVNNFDADRPRAERCVFYAHSGLVGTGATNTDGMRMWINHGGCDQRSYVPLSSTLDLVEMSYAPSDVVVIVDPSLCTRSDGSWLREDNDELTWTWVRTTNGERELDAGTSHCLWRPIAPVRWLARLPAWAGGE